MKLPFLKTKKMPRMAPGPTPEKLVNGSPSDHIQDHCMGELFDAAESKDVKKFRSAIEALVLDMFEDEYDATIDGEKSESI